ncbi:putative Beta-N-acetylglucosaminidase precursor [Frankia alni ACN14a]|uniref:beta-N-acetylhexosaminidase n=1 Tax=Frankia alni (strain DSM 45986 / CECT 9034 / ACN14a) TaxID=326424 RepID=Q0RSB5_FRAAA|nr:putative Beta-N-acetylglucosaminidase precursor [Frankia alni ACN14a]
MVTRSVVTGSVVTRRRRRPPRAVVVLLACLLLVAGCFGRDPERTGGDGTRGATPPAPDALAAAVDAAHPTASPGTAATADPTPGSATDDAETAWVDSTLARMTPEQRIGQLLMGYVFGTTPDDRTPAALAGNRTVAGTDTAAAAVRELGLGGVVLFDAAGAGPGALPDNVIAPGQVLGLTAGLQGAAAIPLLVAADQEQGPVMRIRDGVTLLPDAMAQGASGRVEDARDAARVTGTDLRALGINVDFAPDADVNTNPANPVIGERSFGDDPAAVARLTAAAVSGFASAGVAAAPKHFPGHGSTSVDSHLDLPVVASSRERLDAVDLAPFRAAVAAGAPMVMVGHLLATALDGGSPASLSPSVVTSLLRRELGFDGVVVTDALNMAAITRRYSPGEAAVRAVLAGDDLLLMPPRLVEARDGLLAALRSGRIPAGRIDESARRVLRLKWRLAHASPAPAGDGPAVAARVASRSVTLLTQDCGILPLRAGAPVTVAGSSTAAARLRAALAARGVVAPAPGTTAPPPGGSAAAGPGGAAETAPVTIVLAGGAGPPARTGPGTVVVSTATPYHPPTAAAAWLATYSADPASLAALADVLTGAAPPRGRLPVAATAPSGRPLPRGSGLTALRPC